MVVEQCEFFKRRLQCCFGRNDQLAQHRFQGSEQSLDSSVLPGRACLDALVPNADQLQESGEDPTGKDDLVICAYATRLAMPTDGQAQVTQQRPAALVCQCLQAGEQA